MTYVFRKKTQKLQLSHFLIYIYWLTTHEYFSWENAYKIPGLDVFHVLPESICLSRLVHVHIWAARSSLSSWLWSSFLLSDFAGFALHLQTAPISISSPSGHCLFVSCVCCGMCGCADAGAPEVVFPWSWSQSTLVVQTWYRLSLCHWISWVLVCAAFRSLIAEQMQSNVSQGRVSVWDPACRMGLDMESNSVIQWGLMQALYPLSCTVI